MELDKSLQARLRRLAQDDEEQRPDLAALTQQLAETGPLVVRRARARRWMRQGITGALALAAAVLLALWFRGGSKEEQGPLATTAAPSQDVSCRGRSVAAGRFVELDPTTRLLDLGVRGGALLEGDGEAKLLVSEACRTVIQLDRGELTVHADDLGGGELLVYSGDTKVRVLGTVFRVSREDEQTQVATHEGTVAVYIDGWAARHVTAGQSLRAKRGTVQNAPLPETDRKTIASTLDRLEMLREPAPTEHAAAAGVGEPGVEASQTGEPAGVEAAEANMPSAAPPQPGASQRAAQGGTQTAGIPSLLRAEQLRRQGRLDESRSLYRQVGSGQDASAEAAWLGLARLELAAGRPSAALRAARNARQRFRNGSLGPESWWLSLRAARAAGDLSSANDAAETLRTRYPGSSFARAAERWQRSQSSP